MYDACFLFINLNLLVLTPRLGINEHYHFTNKTLNYKSNIIKLCTYRGIKPNVRKHYY